MVKKNVKKKSSVKKVSPRIKRNVSRPKRLVRASQRKISLSLKNLILFAVLSLISFLLYNSLSNDLYVNLFLLLAIISC